MRGTKIRDLIVKSTVTEKLKQTVGHKTYARIRSLGLSVESSINLARRRAVLLRSMRGPKQYSVPVVLDQGYYWEQGGPYLPLEAGDRNRSHVTGALTERNVEWWFVDLKPRGGSVIGVSMADRQRALHALSHLDESVPGYLRGAESKLTVSAHAVGGDPHLAVDTVVSYFAPYQCRGTALRYSERYACDIEFWDLANDPQRTLVEAPRENRASKILSAEEARPTVQATAAGLVPRPKVLSRVMLDDITFPIDAVYTWVDGDDPEWLNSKGRREAELSGVEYHDESNHAARSRSRDELKYSLRSLAMYAPWFNRIFIVTAGQRPDWLNTDNPKVVLIDHQEIYPAGDFLPTFNSNSIISRLHHIPGLSEHYVYINDDVFFGREVGPERFFMPSGIAKVSPSNNRRPFGATSIQDEPHLNLTRNMRSLLEQEFGVTISRAIKHTPHPQLKSVHFEMEQKFIGAYQRTWLSPFRHHEDIVADQLHHYYAQITGRAVPTNLRYNYINILDDTYRGTMSNTLRLRHRDTFCINDAPVPGATPMSDDEVTEFLESYFPIKCEFEN